MYLRAMKPILLLTLLTLLISPLLSSEVDAQKRNDAQQKSDAQKQTDAKISDAQKKAELLHQKADQIYDRAITLLKDEYFQEAIPVLQQCIDLDSNFIDAYLSLGATYGQLKEYDASVKLYEKARSKDTAYFQVYKLPYAINLAGQGRFKDALQQVIEFQSIEKLSDRSKKAAAYRKNCLNLH